MPVSTYSPPDSPLSMHTLLDDSDGYTIRALTSADVPAALKLFTKLQPTAPALSPSYFTRLLVAPHHTALLAFPSSDPNTPVGLLAAAAHTPNNDLCAHTPLSARLDVLLLGVLPAHRRRHLAARLVCAAARRLEAPRVRAEVRVRDAEGRAFWSGMGCAEEVEARPWRAGAWGEVVRLEGRVEV
ncbi:hypothetical protein K488DRAFT_71577 [Vararia minispora EC-137]|uniref:Uncharacterized protein n=1 Tax=Vararia minispora EC-137 TaxID=1314806 RepID=A0ACB8QI11_9AGAM|nr:hypothetical protein K488DRAFT_71577 [Vararia minispora EC-137]